MIERLGPSEQRETLDALGTGPNRNRSETQEDPVDEEGEGSEDPPQERVSQLKPPHPRVPSAS